MRSASSIMGKEPGDESKRFIVTEDARTSYLIPAYGYLERIELRLPRLLENMNAAKGYIIKVDLYGPEGEHVPITVEAWCRSVRET